MIARGMRPPDGDVVSEPLSGSSVGQYQAAGERLVDDRLVVQQMCTKNGQPRIGILLQSKRTASGELRSGLLRYAQSVLGC